MPSVPPKRTALNKKKVPAKRKTSTRVAAARAAAKEALKTTGRAPEANVSAAEKAADAKAPAAKKPKSKAPAKKTTAKKEAVKKEPSTRKKKAPVVEKAAAVAARPEIPARPKRGEVSKGLGRGHGVYKSAKGRVASVTTVLNRFKDSGGLIHWAFNQGKAAQRGEISSLYDKRDDAAEAGTAAHNMIEAWLHNEDIEAPLARFANKPDQVAAARKGFDNFMEWFENSGIRITATEPKMVCEKMQVGGTPDAIGIDSRGRVVLLDWKTSNAVYADYLLQIAAYGRMWANAGKAPIERYHLLRFSKEYGDFAHHSFEELEDAANMFELLREAHTLDKVVRKRIG